MPHLVSKAAENALTIILGRENPKVLINCCCPGWVKTDTGDDWDEGAPKTLGECLHSQCPVYQSSFSKIEREFVEEGIRIPPRLAFGDIGDLSGRYWANDDNADTGYGKVQNC